MHSFYGTAHEHTSKPKRQHPEDSTRRVHRALGRPQCPLRGLFVLLFTIQWRVDDG